MNKYKKVDVNSKEPVQYCGYYVLEVDNSMPKPDCLFVECDDDCCEASRKQAVKEVISELEMLITGFSEPMNVNEAGFRILNYKGLIDEIRKRFLDG